MIPSSEVPLIDLGLERDVPEQRPDRRGNWPGFRAPAARRRWALAGCLALVLLAVAGAAPPPPPSLFLVGSQPPAGTTGYQLVDDQLFVMTGGEEPVLSAYRARDGKLLWSVPATGSWLGAFQANAGLVLVATQPTQGCCTVSAYDRANGEVRWTWRGDSSDVDFDGNLLAIGAGAAKQVLEVSTGRVLWRSGGSAVVRIAGPHHILLAHPDGTAERRDLSTGEVQARGRIHPPDEQLSSISIVDDQLIVGSSNDLPNGTVGAYDLDSLRPVWHRTGRLIDGASRCGPVLCLGAGYGLEAVDPHTGAVRWRESEWYGVEQGGDILALTPEPGKLRPVGVVDPSTGRMLLDLDSWDISTIGGHETQLVLTRTAAGRTTVAVADLTSLIIQVVGVIPDLVAECQSEGADLACRSSTGRLQLWAYRR